MQIVRADQPAFSSLWDRLRESGLPRTALYTPLDCEYLKNYPQAWRAHDLSFVVEDEGTPLAGAMMALRPLSEGFELSAFGRPILYLETPGLRPFLPSSLFSFLKEELDRVRAAHAIREIQYQNPGGWLTALGKYMLDAGAQAIPVFSQVLDLDLDEDGLRQAVRKSYKSLINWGEKHLCPNIVDQGTLEEAVFEPYRELHLLAAGRETRSRATWQINAEMIRQGQAFLVLGRLDGRLVTGAFFNVFGDACYYSNAASDRDLFEKPLGHCITWRGLLHARSLGCRLLDMGEIFFTHQPVGPTAATKTEDGQTRANEKNLNIAIFKRGFGGRPECRLNIVWRDRT
jgi:hypothetical protein